MDKVPQTKNLIISFPEPQILLVTINRPAKLNALNWESHKECAQIWDWYAKQDHLRVAIIRGAPESKAFCAGADLETTFSTSTSADQLNNSDILPMISLGGFGGLSCRTDLYKPVIAVIHGYCLGGGTELALACDIIIAEKNSQFGIPEIKRGVWAGMGGLPLLSKTVGYRRASEMALLGRKYSAQQMNDWGFVNFVEKDLQSCLEKALEISKEICENAPSSLKITKFALLRGLEVGFSDSVRQSIGSGVNRDWSFGEDALEGVKAFLEKRKPNFSGKIRSKM